MNRQSIFFSISVSFFITLVLVVLSFGVIMFNSTNHLEHELKKRYFPISKIIIEESRKNGLNEELKNNLETMNYELYLNKNDRNKVLYNPSTKVVLERVDEKKEKLDRVFRILSLDDEYYIFLKSRNYEILLKDENSVVNNQNFYIIVLFIVIILTILLSYITTIRKLIPLKLLKDKVVSLGEENFNFECCNLKGNDEVSSLAREFKNSAKKLENIKKARNIFIRNIMHELKTPITKGKILVELPKSEGNDEKMKLIFDRLNSLINEFATIEELIASNTKIEKSIYFLTDIVENATDILMCEDDEVVSEYENIKLNVNFRLFSLAIKNLIENALKYSPNKKVTIKTQDEKIILENDGESLSGELKEYFEPFISKDSKGNSFGLGLYIVHNILEANNYVLEYEYIENKNRFIIVKKDEE